MVIDDDHAMRLSCLKVLAKSGFHAEAFEDGAAGLEGVARLKPALVLVDLKMPGMCGMEVIDRLHELEPLTTIVVFTGQPTIGAAVEAIQRGAYDFLPKPFFPDELRVVVHRGLERRRLALEAERARLDRALVKGRFMTFISQQLQTPLESIRGCLEDVRRLEGDDGAGAERTGRIQRCLAHTEEMLSLIKDWLSLAVVEAAQLSPRRLPVDLCDVIGNILKGYSGVAARENIRLSANLPAHPCIVIGDRTSVGVLMDNLVVNAIKYNRPGGQVTVSVEPVESEFVVAIADTGIGIPEQYRGRLFDEFFRVQDNVARSSSGTGLGLSICKKIISSMGGKIELESEAGKGTVFRVSLLMAPSRPEQGADG